MNVLIIMTDQQRTDSVNELYTPNINKLSKQSLVFNCYAQSPQCQPARAAFWTGRYPSSLRMWWNEMELAKTERTLANILRDAQYETAYFGKWHLDRTTHTLEHFGFNPKYSYLSEDWRDGKDLPGRDAGAVRREYLEIMKTKSWSAKLSGRLYQHEDVISERAVQFMSNCKQPFLCAIGFRGPHPPYAAPPPYCDMYNPTSFKVSHSTVETYDGGKLLAKDIQAIKSQYYGCVSWIDDNIGRIMDFVNRKASDTIVVFTSDHGDMLGDHGYFSKGLYAYEQIVSVPLIVRIPGWGPKRCEWLVEHIDVLPTILELLNQEAGPGLQGKSLAISSLRCVLSMVGYKQRLRMVRSNRFKYWVCGDDEYLFDLEADPGEMVNRAESMPRAVSKMRHQLIRRLIAAEDPLPIPEL